MTKQSKKIFVVDDDIFHLEIMKQLLKEEGITEVSVFEDGVSVLNDIHHNPDVVFLDHQMDVYTGYEVLRKIKRHNPNIFVVMVSAQEDLKTAINTMKYGAFDYLQKDDMLNENVKSVLLKIEEVKELLRMRKPSLVKSLLNFL
jgi:DNA-binding NtrC family response regulator